MVFSSLLFLYAYLPAVLLVYYLLPRRAKNLWLLLASLLFYAWGEPICVLLMIFSILSAYWFGLAIAKHRADRPRRARMWLILSIVTGLSLLFFFKYYVFFADTLETLVHLSLPRPARIALPIGISFYTFQILSYTVDVWRGDCGAQRDLVSFGAYVTLFPQLIAGPIVRYSEVDDALRHRRETLTDVAAGVLRFSVGLSKKVLLGDPLAAGYTYFLALSESAPTTLGAWMSALLYALHLYYDFSGYSDMAIGLGRMLGFRFPENFRYPYVAKSITEFWRRWHVTLSSWFREYVYIPMGGNRKGRARQYLNLAVVWLLTGLWHGANWNFVLWGAFFLLFLILEKSFLLQWLSHAPSWLGRGYTFTLVVISFVLFSTPDLSLCATRLLQMLGVGVRGFADAVGTYEVRHLLPLLAVALVGATPLLRRLWERICLLQPRLRWLTPVLAVLSLVLCTAYLVDSTFSPFEYTQF